MVSVPYNCPVHPLDVKSFPFTLSTGGLSGPTTSHAMSEMWSSEVVCISHRRLRMDPWPSEDVRKHVLSSRSIIQLFWLKQLLLQSCFCKPGVKGYNSKTGCPASLESSTLYLKLKWSQLIPTFLPRHYSSPSSLFQHLLQDVDLKEQARHAQGS